MFPLAQVNIFILFVIPHSCCIPFWFYFILILVHFDYLLVKHQDFNKKNKIHIRESVEGKLFVGYAYDIVGIWKFTKSKFSYLYK